MRSLFRRTSFGGKRTEPYKNVGEQGAVSLEDAQFEFLPGITPRSPDECLAPAPGQPGALDSAVAPPPRPLENPPLTFLNSNARRKQNKDFSNINASPRVPSLSMKMQRSRRDSGDSVFSFNGDSKDTAPGGGGDGETLKHEDELISRSREQVAAANSKTREQSVSKRGRGRENSKERGGGGREDSVMSRRDDSVSRRPGLMRRLFSAKGRRKDDEVVKVVTDTNAGGANTSTTDGAQSSARSHEMSARSARSNLTDPESEDPEAFLQYAQYLLSSGESSDPSKLCSKEHVQQELKRVPEISWLVKCAMQAPLPAFWTLHTPKGKENATPYYANSQTMESCWTHPSDATFKSMILILQRGMDIRGQLRNMYSGVLQQAEKLSTQWQGPYYENEKAYYHHLSTGRSVWGDPFANSHYIAEICVKLLGFFGSRADVLEAAGGFSKRKEALRQARSRLEQEVGPLDSQELAYLYQGNLPGAVLDPSPSVQGGSGQHAQNPHVGASHPMQLPGHHQQPGAMVQPGAAGQMHLMPHMMQNPMMAGANPMMAAANPMLAAANPLYNPAAAGQFPQFAYGAPGAAPGVPGMVYPNPQMAMQYSQGYNPALQPPQPGQMQPAPNMYTGGSAGGHQQQAGSSSSSYNTYQHQQQHAPDYYSNASAAQYGDPRVHPGGGSAAASVNPADEHRPNTAEQKGSEWFNNDRNLVRCNSRGKRRDRSRSKSKEPDGSLRKLVRVNSRDSLPKDMRLPSPFSHGYKGPAQPEQEHYVRTNTSLTGSRNPSPAPQPRVEDLMRQSRDYADRQLKKAPTPGSDGKTLTYSDDSDQEVLK
ncbi:unnamed protein product [Amoebophrya sp. A120]|nr:unnamed protein product [Amoebophrya sp. A120]|eukprot:GSA120T00011423001.1